MSLLKQLGQVCMLTKQYHHNLCKLTAFSQITFTVNLWTLQAHSMSYLQNVPPQFPRKKINVYGF